MMKMIEDRHGDRFIEICDEVSNVIQVHESGRHNLLLKCWINKLNNDYLMLDGASIADLARALQHFVEHGRLPPPDADTTPDVFEWQVVADLNNQAEQLRDHEKRIEGLVNEERLVALEERVDRLVSRIDQQANDIKITYRYMLGLSSHVVKHLEVKSPFKNQKAGMEKPKETP
jgi:hypothetical protein